MDYVTAGATPKPDKQDSVFFNRNCLSSLSGLEGLAKPQTLTISDNDSLNGLSRLEGLAELKKSRIFNNPKICKQIVMLDQIRQKAGLTPISIY